MAVSTGQIDDECWSIGAKVFVESQTGEGCVSGKVVTPVHEGLLTIEYEWNGQRLRKSVPQNQLSSFSGDDTIPKLYHEWLRGMHGSKCGDLESLREIQVEKVMAPYRKLMVTCKRPKAVYITGNIASGKSTFMKRVGNWDGFVHVNADNLREQLVGGAKNAQIILDLPALGHPVRQDMNKTRGKISEETIKAKANLVADSLTIPADAALKCVAAGYEVTVIYIEPGGTTETIEEGGQIFEGRDAVVVERNIRRSAAGDHRANIDPGAVDRNFKEMSDVAQVLKTHSLPVHHILSKGGLFTYQGTLVPMCSDVGRDDAEKVVAKLINF